MQKIQKKIMKPLTFVQRVRVPVPSTPQLALRAVTSKENMGVYASSDTVYRGAIFGRDSIEVAEDLLFLRPKLAKKIILTLASLQGEKINNRTEEEPGKIVHEYRREVVEGKRIKGPIRKIYDELAAKWGEEGESIVFYASVDSTPLFIRLVCRYCDAYGRSILRTTITLRSGRTATLHELLDNSLSWLIDKIDNSKSGLVEYKRLSPDSYPNQTWKDSEEFYVHESGKKVNHNKPVASIEIQGLAYDSLVMAAALFQEKQKEYLELAESLRQRTIEILWLPERSYFALGTDFDRRGRLRIIKTETANPAELLDTLFFDGLTEAERQLYVGGIVRGIMGTHFLTDAGIRSRGLAGHKLVAFWDYHGSYVTWPKETYDIAKGLSKQGFPKLAFELENRLLNLVKAFKSYPEFLYVDYRGRVLGASTKRHHQEHIVLIKSTDLPEAIQAWTVSAIVAISAQRRIIIRLPNLVKKRQEKQFSWQQNVETEILRNIPHVPLLRTRKELSARYPYYPYEVSRAKIYKYFE